MPANIGQALRSPAGKAFISVILGIGLASMFRKVCNDKNCITFKGAVIQTVDEKIYQYGDHCYKYTSQPVKCDPTKKIVDIASPENVFDPSYETNDYSIHKKIVA